MARRNLISNPSFTTGISGWGGRQGATLLPFSEDGRACVKVVKTILLNSGAITADYIAVTGGASHSISGYFYIPVGQPTSSLTISVIWYNFTAPDVYEEVGVLAATPVTVSTGDGWVRITQIGTAPATATHAKVSAYQPATGTADSFFLLDSVLFEQSDYVGSFIDVINQAQETEIVNRALSKYHDLNYITGLQLNADVQLGDLVFNTIDENDIVWMCTDIEGWWTVAEPSLPDIPRGFQDGSYDVSGRYQARVLTLTGVFITQHPSDVGIAREKLLTAVDLVRKGAWLRTSENPTRASFVRLSGKPTITTVNARGRTEFSIGLKAADPIKYKWDDTKVDGVTVSSFDLAEQAPNEYQTTDVTNEGTATVTAKLVFTGPLGAGSTLDVYHDVDGSTEKMTIIDELRGAGAVATITYVEMTEGVVTVTTLEQHGLSIGETVSVSGTSTIVDTTAALITAVTDTLPYSFNYVLNTTASIAKTASSGVVSLNAPDEMIVDTYHRNVSVNGSTAGYRSKLETLTDWPTLTPGVSTVTFTDSIDPSLVSLKEYNPINNIVTLTTNSSHFLTPGQNITVNFPTTAQIAYKSMASSVATITTKSAHGYSDGDIVTVATTLDKTITNKQMTSGVATLKVSLASGETLPFSSGDSVLVALNTSASIISKSRVGTTVTLTTAGAHGFSNGDLVTVPFSVSNYVGTKAYDKNVATITTQTPHNYSVTDQVTVALPVTTTVTTKTITGTQVVLTTSSTHNYSLGDKISVSLPVTATPTSTKTFYGSSRFTVTARSADTATCTLTTSAAHNISVGNTITVFGVGARYDGVSLVAKTGTTGTTVVYDRDGSAESSISSIGAVTNTSLSHKVLVETTSAHGYVVGDQVTINPGIPSTVSIATRSATSSACTLTVANHGFVAGEHITVTGVSARYNIADAVITSVTTNTFTYSNSGTAESSTSSTGTVVNNTLANGYGGTKIVEAVPSSTTFTCYYYGQENAVVNSNAGSSPSITNDTNTSLNGTVTLTAVSTNTMTYTKGA
jgi:hypothetical protein